MAQKTIEMVRFTVRPGAEEALVSERPAMVEAVRAEFPGMLSARLAKLDETTWLEHIVWTSRETARKATEKAHDIPAVAAWLSHIAEVIVVERADVVVAESR
jgi:quinol monooxygenase YgiN